ncbi:histidinol-phosphate transaminase [Pseudonocardiaceae bacterium YIM PH 21723]|nr:histidinol-phosphate transaminase [Pseudonocardiaceae bacterium YIM PH 21723]
MMTVRTRADLAQLPLYVPGRTIEGAIKLASNEVSAGPLPSVVEAITAAATSVNRYPDSAGTALIAKLAGRLGVTTDEVAIAAGSVQLCQQLVQATCTTEDEMLHAWRSFEAYPLVAAVVGASSVQVPLTDGHDHDLDRMLAAITPATRLIFVCNPNNPTGNAIPGDRLRAFLDQVPAEIVVVLDEAYREFVTDESITDGMELLREQRAKGRDNVVVMRTFSKAYGLAGLRVGYLAGPAELVTALRKVYLPFSVNSVAQAAAIASLDAQDELATRCKEIAAERGRVTAALREAGFEVPDSEANFVYLPLGERTPAFNEHCLDHKVIVRAYATDGARVTIGTPAENDAFLAAALAFTG